MNKSIIDILHYGSAGLLMLLSALSAVGLSLPGVTVDSKVSLAAGVGILVAGFKSGLTAK